VARTHNAWLGTRITENAGVRLRQLALIRLRCLSHALDDVPGALPTVDLAVQLGRLASSGREASYVSR
jgi:hypothetical protein